MINLGKCPLSCILAWPLQLCSTPTSHPMFLFLILKGTLALLYVLSGLSYLVSLLFFSHASHSYSFIIYSPNFKMTYFCILFVLFFNLKSYMPGFIKMDCEFIENWTCLQLGHEIIQLQKTKASNSKDILELQCNHSWGGSLGITYNIIRYSA